jgi:hypothetical protein
MNPALKELEKIFFPVKKVKASAKISHSSWLSHEIVVTTPNGDMRVNVCSEDYNLVPNKKLFTPIVEKLSEDWEIEARVSVRDWAKFYVDFIFKDKPCKGATKKDLLFPRLRMVNSYDGSVKYSFYFAIWRLICSNGARAVIPESVRQGKFMHTPQLGDNEADNNETALAMLERLGHFIGNFKEIVQGYQPLIQSTRTETEALTLMQEVQLQTSYPKKLVEVAYQRLQLESHQLKQPINDYLVYNALNYALFQGGQSEIPEHKKDKKDSEVLDYLLAEIK